MLRLKLTSLIAQVASTSCARSAVGRSPSSSHSMRSRGCQIIQKDITALETQDYDFFRNLAMGV